MRNTLTGIAILCFCLALHAEEYLVLRNGKIIEIPDTYKVQGNYVVFTAKSGETLQLPSKMIDFEKSKAYTEQRKAANEERERQQAEAQVRREAERTKTSMAEIAAAIEKNRPEEEDVPTALTIDSKKVNKYGEDRPLPENTAMPSTVSIDNNAAEEFDANRDRFASRYAEVQNEISNLQKQIELTKNRISAYQNQLAYGDDPGGAAYDAMEQEEKNLKTMESELKSKQDELKSLETEARRAGVVDMKRNAAKKQKQRTVEKED